MLAVLCDALLMYNMDIFGGVGVWVSFAYALDLFTIAASLLFSAGAGPRVVPKFIIVQWLTYPDVQPRPIFYVTRCLAAQLPPIKPDALPWPLLISKNTAPLSDLHNPSSNAKEIFPTHMVHIKHCIQGRK